jgi:outer membrane beta-barrel protein
MKFRVSLLILVTVAAGSVAQAQIREGTVEITPFAGYLFGGEFARGTTSLFNVKVNAEDDATYGVRLGYNLTEKFEMEFQWSRTESAFVTNNNHELFGSNETKFGDLNIDYYMGYGTFNFGHRRAIPYITIGAGVARLDPKVPGSTASSDTRFTGSLGIGLKAFVNPHFGLRFDGRGYATSLGSGNGSNDFGCGRRATDGSCSSDRKDWLTNGELSGGLIFAF